MLLVVDEADAPRVRGYEEQPGRARFPRSRASAAIQATVLAHDGRTLSRVSLHDLALAHPHLQPLPGDEILLVGARCKRLADGTAEHNAHIYGSDGLLRRTATFGDGIANVQATTSGDIWVSYFDEGIFGNYG